MWPDRFTSKSLISHSSTSSSVTNSLCPTSCTHTHTRSDTNCVCVCEGADHHLIILHLLFHLLFLLALLLLLQSSIKGVNREVVDVSVLKQTFATRKIRFCFFSPKCQIFFLWTLEMFLWWGTSHRSLLESLQQLLLDGVVQLSGDQSFFLPTPTHTLTHTHTYAHTHSWSTSLTSFLFSLLSTFLLRGTNFLLHTHTHSFSPHRSWNRCFSVWTRVSRVCFQTYCLFRTSLRMRIRYWVILVNLCLHLCRMNRGQ